MKEQLAQMQFSIHALALELPEKVWDDVKKKWDRLKAEIVILPKCPCHSKDDACTWFPDEKNVKMSHA